jgi:hypothetical protein
MQEDAQQQAALFRFDRGGSGAAAAARHVVVL